MINVYVLPRYFTGQVKCLTMGLDNYRDDQAILRYFPLITPSLTSKGCDDL